MKLWYVCECCDAVVDVLEVPARPPAGSPAGLTGLEQGGIIEAGVAWGDVTLSTLCEDCRETLYGGPEPGFFSGPVTH